MRWQQKLKEAPVEASLLQSASPVDVSLAEIYEGQFSDFAGRRHKMRLSDFDCFNMFNPSSRPEYEQSVANWASSYLKLAVLTAPHVLALSNSSTST